MKYEIKATEEQLDNLYKGLQIGLPLDSALKLAKISPYIYLEWQKNADLLDKIQELELTADDLETLYSVLGIKKKDNISNELITKYNADTEYREYVNACANIITRVLESREKLKVKLLQDIYKANKDKNKEWNASAWLLERIDPNNFSKEKQTDNNIVKQKESIKVEFVAPNNDDTEKRIKEMEDKVSREINGESKA